MYQKGHRAHLYAATGGTNGWCETYRAYLCHGEPGYDARTGLGTPDGISAFASTTAGNTISVTDPGTEDVSSAGKSLTYTAGNLPAGLSTSKSGVISGTAPKTVTALTSDATITAADSTGAKGSASFDIVVTPNLASGYHQTTGQVSAVFTTMCLDDTGDAAANGTTAEFAPCATTAEHLWALVPNPMAGGSDRFQLPAGPIESAVGSMCVEDPGNSTTSGTAVELEPCDGSSAQTWGDFSDFLFSATGDPATHQGLCLTAVAKTNLTYPFEYLEDSPVELTDCIQPTSSSSNPVSYLNSDWETTPNGEIFTPTPGCACPTAGR